jgi:ABC-type proline/glycine betaine transport system ATPase subunit
VQIIDSDRILVLDDGRAVEFDSAAKLLKNKQGLFSSLVQSTGSANAHYLERIAAGSVDMEAERAQQAREGKRKLDRESISRKWMSATRWGLVFGCEARRLR